MRHPFSAYLMCQHPVMMPGEACLPARIRCCPALQNAQDFAPIAYVSGMKPALHSALHKGLALIANAIVT